MLVYVALALAVALVLRRGDGPGVLGGVVLGVTRDLLRTRSRRDSSPTASTRTTTRSTRIAGRAARILERARAAGVARRCSLTLGFVAHARRSALGACAAAALPIMATTLYFTFSRGAWAALVDRLRRRGRAGPAAAAAALDVTRRRAPVRRRASRTRLASMRSRPRTRLAVSAARDGHRVAVVVCVALASSVRRCMGSARRSPGASRSLGARRRVLRRRACTVLCVAAVGSVLVAAGGPRAALDGLEERFNAEPAVGDVDLNERLFSISGNGGASSFASPGMQGANGRSSATARARSSTSGTSGDRTCSSCATRTRFTWRRSPSSASSGSRLLVGALLLLLVPERPRAQDAVRRCGHLARSLAWVRGQRVRLALGDGRCHDDRASRRRGRARRRRAWSRAASSGVALGGGDRGRACV